MAEAGRTMPHFLSLSMIDPMVEKTLIEIFGAESHICVNTNPKTGDGNTGMTLRAEFAMRHSDLEPFLLGSIWQENNGSMLSILSAFARLGMDPWQEAARLAAMPRDAAAVALAKLLALLPQPSPEPPDHAALARHLVEELPKRQARRPTDTPGQPKAAARLGSMNMVLFLTFAAVLGFLQVTGQLF